MAQQFKLPNLGEEVDEGDVLSVLVSVGDTVSADQNVIELETDKATLDVPCSLAGKVTEVLVSEGDRIKVGDPILSVDTDGQVEATEQKAQEPEHPKPKREPEEQERREPEKRKSEEPVQRKRAPQKVEQEEEEEVAEEQEEFEEQREAPPPKREPQREAEEEPLPAGPATRRLARELGVDLDEVARANPDERLTPDHVKRFVHDRLAAQATAHPGAVRVPPLPDFSRWGLIDRVPRSATAKRTAERMSVAWRVAPQVTHCDRADITLLESIRERYADRSDDHPKLTLTAFIIKACVTALKEHPKFNASLDEAADELILKHYYHIGAAVDTDRGLLVPVIRDCDSKTVLQIAADLQEMAERARGRKIKLEDMQGGTFTVTNVGGIGGTMFTPIINYPEVAILGVTAATEQPDDDTRRLMLPLCLTFDHRVINGADAARFARTLIEALEDPEALLLGG